MTCHGFFMYRMYGMSKLQEHCFVCVQDVRYVEIFVYVQDVGNITVLWMAKSDDVQRF